MDRIVTDFMTHARENVLQGRYPMTPQDFVNNYQHSVETDPRIDLNKLLLGLGRAGWVRHTNLENPYTGKLSVTYYEVNLDNPFYQAMMGALRA